MAMITIRYWSAAKEAAGVAAESCEAGTLAEALAAVLARRDGAAGDRLRGVLTRSSFLVDGAPAGVRRPEDISLAGAAVIEVLPPFAGG
ncbi:MAG TPA: MoaD/ThiS family protein [Streptosporangiaceae bacterium]|jgi:molybdopterin converting factor small subunit